MRDSKQSNLKLRQLGLVIALGLAIAAFISGYWSFSISNTENAVLWWVGWLQDVGTEMLGSAVTILLVELVIYQKRDEVERLDRERMRRRDQFAERLKRTPRIEVRQKIIDQMRRQDLLTGAWLYEVHLEGADLSHADMQDTDLFEAQLNNTNLNHANLQNGILRRANLNGANLRNADLRGTDLQEADLRGADLTEASLINAELHRVKCDAKTVLPDGSHWQPDTDFEQFIEVDDPKLWQAASLAPLSVIATSLIHH